MSFPDSIGESRSTTRQSGFSMSRRPHQVRNDKLFQIFLVLDTGVVHLIPKLSDSFSDANIYL
jgi:hypothetical protein